MNDLFVGLVIGLVGGAALALLTKKSSPQILVQINHTSDTSCEVEVDEEEEGDPFPFHRLSDKEPWGWN